MIDSIPRFEVHHLRHFCVSLGLLALDRPGQAQHFAKIAVSTLLSDIRKKAGSAVFQGGRAGLVVRKHAIPRQPRSATQLTLRGNFSTNSKDWGAALTQDERDAWIAFASTISLTDRLGRRFVPTGIQMFQMLNRNLHTISEAGITSPPADLNVSSPLTATLVATHTGAPAMTVDEGSYAPIGTTLVVFAGPQVSPGISAPGSKQTFLGKFAGAIAAPTAILTAYEAKFGTLIVGKKVFVEIMHVITSSGAASGRVSTSAIVT